jgi:hypothetical protein
MKDYPRFTWLFGKEYIWDLDSDGLLRLSRVVEGQAIKNRLTYEDLVETLDRVREEGL